MMRVSNRKAVRRLSWKSFQANRIRNIFAIIAMLLTTVLFTSLFTAAVGLTNSYKQLIFRQHGDCSHANSRYLTNDQKNQLSTHPLIKGYGENLILSILKEEDFAINNAVIRYYDEKSAKLSYAYPTTGTLPKGKFDIATETAVLKKLGVTPKLGEKVTISYPLGEKTITQTFTLCGYWTSDEQAPNKIISISKDYALAQLENYKPKDKYNIIGTWELQLMFSNSFNIDDKLMTIAADSGFQMVDDKKDNYVFMNKNIALMTSNTNQDSSLILAVLAVALLILFTGYLIIYNIFLISVTGDIRFYGLLKTIGTTGRQIKRIIRRQALLLSVIGLPIGLILGYVIGTLIATLFVSSMKHDTYMKADPIIFIGAALFTIFTVLISIHKPGKVASKVSPVEAIRYTEGGIGRKKLTKKSKHGLRIYHMAISNLLRNKKKAVIVFISLSLSIILLNFIYAFTKSFDVDKMSSQYIVADYTIGSTKYFASDFRGKEDVVSEEMIGDVMKQEGVRGSGRIYYDTERAGIDFSQKMIDYYFRGVPKEDLEYMYFHLDGEKSKVSDIQLYGMDDYILNKCEVVEGTLDTQKFVTGDYILQVVDTGENEKPNMESIFYHPGDKVEVKYIDKIPDSEDGKIEYHSKTYEVMAVVKANYGMSVRYYSTTAMILPSNRFIKDSRTSTTMSYLIDIDDDAEASMEQFMENYTDKTNTDMDYMSKVTERKSYEKYRDAIKIIGNSVSLIIGIIGILNFSNVILTGIITRRREFSVLKSIGMTGKQLRGMLMMEGLFYAVITILISAACSAVLNSILLGVFEKNSLFFTAHFTLLPVVIVAPLLLIFSLIVPYAAYQATNKKSIVDQLRVLD